MTALVAKVDIGTSLTDITTIGSNRQVVISGSAPFVSYQFAIAEAGSGAAVHKTFVLVADANGDAFQNLPNDSSLFMQYTATGTPGGTAKIWMQGFLFPAS